MSESRLLLKVCIQATMTCIMTEGTQMERKQTVQEKVIFLLGKEKNRVL